MAINLSDLTGASTSANILAEVQSTADFLDSVPLLKNLADPSGATDAKQFTATNQPTALPLIDGKGYLYCSGVAGNGAYITGVDNSYEEIEVEAEFMIPNLGSTSRHVFVSQRAGVTQFLSFYVSSSGAIGVDVHDGATGAYAITPPILASYEGEKVRVKLQVSTLTDDFKVYRFESGSFILEATVAMNTPITTLPVTGAFEIGSRNSRNTDIFNGAIFSVAVRSSFGGDDFIAVDFTSPNVRHGATKFKCATGQVVTINQSGNNPATVIKKPVLRFDGVDDFMDGVFGQTVTGGYMFAAFSVNGDGGETGGRVFSVNSTGSADTASTGAIFSFRTFVSNDIRTYASGAYGALHPSLFSQSNGDILHESVIKDGFQLSQVNNADERTFSDSTTLSSEEFNISATENGFSSAAIDLEYLALFPASITDEQADAVRNYINNRNNVFDLKDGFGYYFFDPQSLTAGAVTSWNGRIVGSDNGDVDKLATQATAADQPQSDGYKVTFADATDHLDLPSTTQAGWQVVGTSLGTFAYKVDSDAITELNLLGNVGDASYRKTGDLYGVILLPENATNRDINEARQLLIDRGASDGVTPQDLANFWRSRGDIVEFGLVDTSSGTNFIQAWRDCSSLTSFPLLDTSSVTTFQSAWYNCSSLTSFPLLDTSSGTDFTQAWFGCSSLTSFPLLDTSSGTTFQSAWFGCSSLTSFPLLDTSSGTNFIQAWRDCSSLTSFPEIDASSGTNFAAAWQNCSSLTSFPLLDTSSGTNFNQAWRSCTSLTSFPEIDASSGTNFSGAWLGCSSLTSFPQDAKLGTEASNVNFGSAWRESGLTSLPALDLSKGVNFLSAFLSSDISSIDPNVLLGTAASSATVEFSNLFNNCQNLTEVPVGLNLSKGNRFQQAFRYCSSLVDFAPNIFDSIGTPRNYCFNSTWQGTVSLNAASVENILVSIDTSGQSAPASGTQITIDYNVATGSLSAATNAAVTSLKSKGWSIIVNNVTL